MGKKILIRPSEQMDSNKKEGREENSLLRMSGISRKYLEIDNPTSFEVSNIAKTGAIKSLSTFGAFSKDIGETKELVLKEKLNKEDLKRTCFVSSETFELLSGGEKVDVLEVVLSSTFSDILIGTDPELLIFDKTGKVVGANGIGNFTKSSKFGSDGAMAELRPDPEYTPEALVNNIQNILEDGDLTKNIKEYNWISACYHKDALRDYPVGTHIHFDNPARIKDLHFTRRERLFAVTNKILDELLAIPMIRLDGSAGHKRRTQSKMSMNGTGYGFFGEWRTCNNRFEYRSLSGLTIANPKLCTDVFGVAKAITEAVYKDVIKNSLEDEYILPIDFSKSIIYQKDFDSWEEIPIAQTFECTQSSEKMKALMDNSSRDEVSIGYIKTWLSKIRKLPTYNKYEKYIESLGEVLQSSAETLDKMEKNIKQTWGVE